MCDVLFLLILIPALSICHWVPEYACACKCLYTHRHCVARVTQAHEPVVMCPSLSHSRIRWEGPHALTVCVWVNGTKFLYRTLVSRIDYAFPLSMKSKDLSVANSQVFLCERRQWEGPSISTVQGIEMVTIQFKGSKVIQSRYVDCVWRVNVGGYVCVCVYVCLPRTCIFGLSLVKGCEDFCLFETG
jgi:hypothetical protein